MSPAKKAPTVATARTAAEKAGYSLEKAEGGYILVDANGTLVAADWANDNGGLSLGDIAKALNPE